MMYQQLDSHTHTQSLFTICPHNHKMDLNWKRICAHQFIYLWALSVLSVASSTQLLFISMNIVCAPFASEGHKLQHKRDGEKKSIINSDEFGFVKSNAVGVGCVASIMTTRHKANNISMDSVSSRTHTLAIEKSILLTLTTISFSSEFLMHGDSMAQLFCVYSQLEYTLSLSIFITLSFGEASPLLSPLNRWYNNSVIAKFVWTSNCHIYTIHARCTERTKHANRKLLSSSQIVVRHETEEKKNTNIWARKYRWRAIQHQVDAICPVYVQNWDFVLLNKLEMHFFTFRWLYRRN